MIEGAWCGAVFDLSIFLSLSVVVIIIIDEVRRRGRVLPLPLSARRPPTLAPTPEDSR